jgi:hypothetical protein
MRHPWWSVSPTELIFHWNWLIYNDFAPTGAKDHRALSKKVGRIETAAKYWYRPDTACRLSQSLGGRLAGDGGAGCSFFIAGAGHGLAQLDQLVVRKS